MHHAMHTRCAWRRIPVYCSHHVDMEYYIDKYMHFELFAWCLHTWPVVT